MAIWRVRAGDSGLRDRVRAVRDDLLRAYLGLDQSEPLPLARTGRGKPYLVHPLRPIAFNLSHTQGMALLAFTTQSSVGIDLERIRPVRDPLRIATRVWPAHAVRGLSDAPDDERLLAFFKGWTRFEACQKRAGSGVFDRPVDTAGLTVYSFSPAPDFVACLAVDGSERLVLKFFDHRSS